MLDVMQRLYPKKLVAQEALVPVLGDKEFWHCSILDDQSFPISGGFGEDRDTARKIAVAEFLERANYRKIASEDQTSQKWGLNLIPTACGFAVGFNRENTIFRSIAEAHERWVMSKWIDDDYFIEEIIGEKIENQLDPVSLYFVSHFDKVLYFKKDIAVEVDGKWFKFEIGQTMGLKGDGIFPGSSAQKTGGNLWQHSLLESFRHLLAVKNNPVRGNVFPDNKVNFFAQNAKVALGQIYHDKKSPWPVSQVKFHHCEHVEDGNYYVARTVVDGWNSWHLGPQERFLY